MIHSQMPNKVTSAESRPRPISLTAGQIFQGRITKLYPQNLAALSINGMNITARLEAALTSGQRYWFEVQGGTGIPRLRVLDENGTRTGAGFPSSSESLAEQLAIPKTKGMNALIRGLTKQNIPFTRQAVLAGSQLLEELKLFNDKGIETLLRLMERQLPITKTSFQAFQATIDEPSISNQLQRLSEQLMNSSHPSADKVNELVSRIVKADPFQLSTPLRGLLLAYAEQDGPHNKRGAEQLLVRLGVIQGEGAHARTYSEFQRAVINPENHEKVTSLWANAQNNQNQNISKQDAKTFFQAKVAQLSIPAGKEGIPQLEQLLQLLQSNERAGRMQEQWIQLPKQSLTSEEKQVLQQTLEGAAGQKQMTAGTHIQTILQMLGYQHEYDVNRFIQGDLSRENLLSERLKALLLNLQQQELPEALKEQVNKVILRLTGQQMFAQEQTGLHQIIMQIPLLLGSFQTDMTMQWEGKRNTNGEFDPDYCRILFYLSLERLEEVVVDVQIQNRVITVSVFNEQEKPEALIDLLLPQLKNTLNKQGYQLLSVKWAKMKEVQTSKQQLNNLYLQNVSYEGVDVRI